MIAVVCSLGLVYHTAADTETYNNNDNDKYNTNQLPSPIEYGKQLSPSEVMGCFLVKSLKTLGTRTCRFAASVNCCCASCGCCTVVVVVSAAIDAGVAGVCVCMLVSQKSLDGFTQAVSNKLLLLAAVLPFGC